MRKYLSGIAILVIFIFIAALMASQEVSESYQQLDTLLLELRNEVLEENWSSAKNTGEKLDLTWTQIMRYLPTLIDHSEVHDLEIRLALIITHLEYQKKDHLLPEIAVARELASNIKEQEKLSLKNIF